MSAVAPFTVEKFQPLANTDADVDHQQPATGALPKLVPIRTSELLGQSILTREWLVPDWIPKRTLTLIQGDGAIGKTSLAQQLQTSCATGLPWLGLHAERCISLGFYTEDEERDLKIRQQSINAAYGCDYSQTSEMLWFPMADADSEMVVFDRSGKPTPTSFYSQIREAALDFRAGLITLDVAVDLFGGDEIKRRHVRGFNRMLTALAREIDGAVVLMGHVSQAGIQSNGGHSGSTDWSNGARSRLYFSASKEEKDDGPADPDARTLARRKSNFARKNVLIELRWKDGVFIPDEPTFTNAFRRPVEDVFLTLLDKVAREKQDVSWKSKAGNFAPTLFANRPKAERDDYRRPDFERAMQSLMAQGKIRTEKYGPPSRQTHVIVVNKSYSEGPDGSEAS